MCDSYYFHALQVTKEIKVTEDIQEPQDCQAHKVWKVMMALQEYKGQRVTAEHLEWRERGEAQDHEDQSLKVRLWYFMLTLYIDLSSTYTYNIMFTGEKGEKGDNGNIL